LTKKDSFKNILCCVIGTSPAVLTETVWCLAHQKHPVIPDEIVVLTTIRGKPPSYPMSRISADIQKLNALLES